MKLFYATAISIFFLSLISCCGNDIRINSEPSNYIELTDFSDIDELYREVSINIMADKNFNGYIIDSTTLPLCLKDTFTDILFIRINKLEGIHVVKSGYASIVKSNHINKYGTAITYLDNEMINLSYNAWHESLRLNSPNPIIVNTNDDRKELVIKQEVHNGTFFQAIVSHYFDINDVELILKRRLALEELCFIPLNNVLIKRILTDNNVDVYLIKDDTLGRKIGSFVAALDSNNKLEITDLVVLDSLYKDVIVTCSP